MLPDKPGWELGGLVAEVWISPAHCAAAFAPGLVFRSFYLREARCARVVLHCYCGITTHAEPIGKVAPRIRRLWQLSYCCHPGAATEGSGLAGKDLNRSISRRKHPSSEQAQLNMQEFLRILPEISDQQSHIPRQIRQVVV